MIEKIDGYKQSIWEKQNPLRHLNRDGMEQNFKFLKVVRDIVRLI